MLRPRCLPPAAAAAAAAAARRSKWSATAACTFIQSVIGGAYCFSIYSPLLKSSQGYDQSTLNSVSLFKDIGGNAGIIAGLLYSLRRPRLVLLAGAALCAAGYLLIWLSVDRILPRPPVLLMCFYMLIAAQSQPFLNTADVVTSVENFPESRGTVIGILKGFVGLSGAILVQIYRTFFKGKQNYFILMLALLPSLLSLLLVYFIEIHHTKETRNNKEFLDSFSLISLCVAGYLTIIIICQTVTSIGNMIQILILVILLLLLVASPLAVVIRIHLQESKLETESEMRDELLIYNPDSNNRPTVGESLNLIQAMCKFNFWLLFLSVACGFGSGLATINNMSQIGSSLGYTNSVTSTLVSLWAILNFLGRFTAGYISDYSLKYHGLARPLYLAGTLLVMSVGHLAICIGFTGSLFVGTTLIGLCYGAQWTLMPSITSEIFGLWHFSTIFNTVTVASPIGSYVLSVRVLGFIYDKEAESQGGACLGTRCFMLSFFIMACTCIVGFLSAFALFLRTRSFYRHVINS